MAENRSGATKQMLKLVFDEYIEETIDDEQIEHVLAPILKMIRAGEFSKKTQSRFVRVFQKSGYNKLEK